MTIEAVDSRARGLRTRRVEEAVGAVGFLRRVDWVLLGAVVAIVLYGLRAIDGITRHDPGGSLVGRQAVYAIAGGVLLVAVTLIDPGIYRRYKSVIYGG